MKATPASILSLLVAATAAPGGAREQREPAPDLVERIRAMTARQISGHRPGLPAAQERELTDGEKRGVAANAGRLIVLASEIDVDQPMAAQGCDDDDIFDIIIDVEETYRIEIDDAEYGSDGNTTDKKLTVRGLARIVTAHL